MRNDPKNKKISEEYKWGNHPKNKLIEYQLAAICNGHENVAKSIEAF